MAIDWERLDVTDPATDLGRLMAEVAYSIQQHGGDFGEAEYFEPFLVEAYAASLPADWDSDALIERAHFYRASSTLPCLEYTAHRSQRLGVAVGPYRTGRPVPGPAVVKRDAL